MFCAFLYALFCYASFSPQGMLIIPNMISVLSEEGQWKFPHEFNPENFLNNKGEFVKPEAFMPFSAGMRENNKPAVWDLLWYHTCSDMHI